MTTYSFAAATALALLTAVGQPAVAHSPQDGLAAFERRIAEYVELHRLAAAAFPPPRLTSDGEEIHRGPRGSPPPSRPHGRVHAAGMLLPPPPA
jgi:hypothetical protein